MSTTRRFSLWWLCAACHACGAGSDGSAIVDSADESESGAEGSNASSGDSDDSTRRSDPDGETTPISASRNLQAHATIQLHAPEGGMAQVPEPAVGEQDGDGSRGKPCLGGKGSGQLGLIDDLEDGDGAILQSDARSGYWYAYNDGSGSQSPAVGSVFSPATGGAEGSAYAAVTSGSGFSGWGAGIGFDLNDVQDCIYDATAYAGIRFMAKSNVTLRLRVVTSDTASVAEGGTCAADAPGNCNNAHGEDIGPTPTWTEHRFAFADLSQEEGWGVQADFDAKKLLKIQFQVKSTNETGIGIPDFRYAIDNVAFY